jgi:hypothetical protein
MMDLRPPSVTGGKVEWAFYKIGSEFHTETYCTGFGGWISVIRNGMACTKSNQVVLVFVSGHVFFITSRDDTFTTTESNRWVEVKSILPLRRPRTRTNS